MLLSIENGLDRILLGWLLMAGLAVAARIATGPIRGMIGIEGLFPLLLLVLAPFASMVLALRWFTDGESFSHPRTRVAILGKWQDVALDEAKLDPLYGAGGIMVSLLVGILLNVPVRAAEYLTSMPPIVGDVPHWLSVLHLMMTLDVVILTSLYTIAFVAALRRAPVFPRLLAGIWLLDIAMQLMIAQAVGSVPGLPPQVAEALYTLLDGNLKKVLISVAIWLPYLLVSRRVNVTYRHRVAARD